MKKGILLSMAASAMIFAGGDIAPVEPAAPAAADFWGQIGFAYQAQDDDFGSWNDQLNLQNGGLTEYNLGDKENNAFSATVVLGVEKELGYGFGFGAELAGWTDFGLDVADGARVNEQLWRGTDQTGAEVSQAYLTYTFGNTAIKAGRQALPAAVSPWAWSDRSAGVLDITYDGIVAVNTDLTDTTLVAAWVANAANIDTTVHIGDNSNGLFMLGLINKSLANTTLNVTGYYIPDSQLNSPYAGAIRAQNDLAPLPSGVIAPVGGFGIGTTVGDTWSIWASAAGSIESINWGVQLAYVDGDSKLYDGGGNLYSMNETYGVAAKIGSRWGDLNAEVILGYINDGSYSLSTAGSGIGSSAFWTDNEELGDSYGEAQTAVLVKVSYKVGIGSLYGSLGYWNYDDAIYVWNSSGVYDAFDSSVGARLGYKFTIAGVNSKVEYRYRKRSGANGDSDQTRQRIRVEAYYKF